MNNLPEQVVNKLIKENKTISFMESCTGGYLASEITNIEGSSNILKASLVTYSNEFKIKFGINQNTIDAYSVYSIEIAKEMSKQVSKFTNSSIGVGITGEIAKGSNNKAYYSIYEKSQDSYIVGNIEIPEMERKEKKEYICKEIFSKILKEVE